jgi:hypothetical protein
MIKPRSAAIVLGNYVADGMMIAFREIFMSVSQNCFLNGYNLDYNEVYP